MSAQSAPAKSMLFRLSLYLALVAGLCANAGATAQAAGGGFKVAGNRVTIRETGQTYIPEGISVYGGLEARNYTANPANTYAQITAAARYWHANTIRLQVAESNMFSKLKKGQAYNPKFLAALQTQVDFAHKLGLAVVINDQTEFTNNTPSPTAETLQFWKVVARQFRTQPSVIFDIFNEPRLTSTISTDPLTKGVPYSPFVANQLLTSHTPPVQMSQARAWTLWRNGGRVNNKHYVGMQTLIRQIRDQHAANLIWAEGTYGARRLPPNRYLLQDANLVYAIHHPNLNSPRSWQRIGTLAARHPVVEGEWAQYQSRWAECFSRAYINAPKYLSYLHAHHVGIIAWSLQPNSLLKGGNSLGQPANLNGADDPTSAEDLKTPDRLLPSYACGARYGQGVGQLLQNYFAQNGTNYRF